MDYILSVDNLTKIYDDIVVVDNASCKIERGSVCGLLGPNGAGKTTLMKMIMNLVKCDGGNVNLDENIKIRFLQDVPEFYDFYTVEEYLNFILDSGVLKKILFKHNQGSSINNLNQGILRDLLVVLPPLAEQRKIAKILATQDRVIELKKKLLEERLRQKKYLMRQLLTGKQRLPGFDGKWKNVKLSEVLLERKEKNSGQNHRICSVAVKKGVVDQIEHLGRSYAAADTSNYGVAHYGDVIYTKSPSGDFPYGIVKQSQMKESVAVSPLYGIFEPVNYELGYVLHTYFGYTINCSNYLLPIIQKGAKNTINITNGVFTSNCLYLPVDHREQKALAKVFAAADREIALLRQDLEQEERKKKALMQLLLTGIVRV